MGTAQSRLFGPATWVGILSVTLVLALLPASNLIFSPGHPLHVSSYVVSLLAKFMCYAIAALALVVIPFWLVGRWPPWEVLLGCSIGGALSPFAWRIYRAARGYHKGTASEEDTAPPS